MASEAAEGEGESWQPCLGPPDLKEDEIHVWRVELIQPSEIYDACLDTLSPDERHRAGRFHFERHRRRYVVARGALRFILGRYLERGPGQLRFTYGRFGKPDLEGGATAAADLRFNLSHAEDIALIALTRGSEIGVDVEFVREEFAGMEVAERFFSRAEVESLRASPEESRADAFFTCWTRKEAYIKALGAGLSHSLQQFTVTLSEGESAVQVDGEDIRQTASKWFVRSVFPGGRYRAATSYQSRDAKFSFLRWSPAELGTAHLCEANQT